jgi:hypothetical protein
MKALLLIVASAAALVVAGQARAQYLPPSGTGVTGGYAPPPGSGTSYDWRADRYSTDRRIITTQPNRAGGDWEYQRNQGYARGRSNNDAIDSTIDKRYSTPTPERNNINDPTADKRYSPPATTRSPGGFIDQSADKRYSPPKPPQTVTQQPATTGDEAEKTDAQGEASTSGPPRTATSGPPRTVQPKR